MLLAFDDLHWADPDSVALLSFLARRLGSLPIGLIGTLRPWPSDAEELALNLSYSGHGSLERLAPLTDRGAAALLSARAHCCLAPEEMARAVKLCVGTLPAAVDPGVFVSLAASWSIALGAAGFFVPNWVLASKAKAARRELRDGVAEMAVLMALAVSAGAGVDAAFRSALEVGGGRFADEVRRARTARPRDGVTSVIDGVAEHLGVPEAATLASAIGATAHGEAVGDALDELAWTMVDDRRIEAMEAGVRAGTRMVMLTAGLMVPG